MKLVLVLVALVVVVVLVLVLVLVLVMALLLVVVAMLVWVWVLARCQLLFQSPCQHCYHPQRQQEQEHLFLYQTANPQCAERVSSKLLEIT